MLVDAIALGCTFAAGFWAGSKFRTWGCVQGKAQELLEEVAG